MRTFWTSRTNYSFNKNMFVDALVQYDPATKLLNSNVRFNLIHAPLSDVFLVYSERRQRDLPSGVSSVLDRGVTLKVTRLVQF